MACHHLPPRQRTQSTKKLFSGRSLVSKSQELSQANQMMTCSPMFSNIFFPDGIFCNFVYLQVISIRFDAPFLVHFDTFLLAPGDQVPQALEPAMQGVPRWSPGLRAWSATSRRTCSSPNYLIESVEYSKFS